MTWIRFLHLNRWVGNWEKPGLNDVCVWLLSCTSTDFWHSIALPEGQFSLVFAAWKAFRGQFAYCLFPRLCLIALIFTQPFLITSVLNLLGKPENDTTHSKGLGLIIATGLIYLGIAVSWNANVSINLADQRIYRSQTYIVLTASYASIPCFAELWYRWYMNVLFMSRMVW